MANISTTYPNLATQKRIADALEKISNSYGQICNKIYPVGSIYISVNASNPNTLFGGTWEKIRDRFLLADGYDYDAGDIGGEEEHTLSISEMPSHAHEPNGNTMMYDSGGHGNSGGTSKTVGGYAFMKGNGYATRYTTNAGGGNSHNNMPPYLVVYMWKRTA